MRHFHLLREYSHEKTIARFSDKIDDRIKSDPSAQRMGIKTSVEAVSLFEEIDPTRKKAFVLLLIKWYLDGSMHFIEDASKSRSAIKGYDKFRNRVKQDISKMSFNEFLDLGDQLSASQSKSEIRSAEEQAFYDNDDATLFVNNENLKIVIPNTEEASIYFGRGTRWCTAADENNMFDEYRDVPLYIIMFKGRPDKWQFYLKPGYLQLMDARDEYLKPDVVRNEKAVQDALGGKMNGTRGCLPYVADPSPDFVESELKAFPRFIKYISNPTTAQIRECAIKGGGEVIKELLARDLITDQDALVIGSRNAATLQVFMGRQTEEMVIRAIANDPYAIMAADRNLLTQEIMVDAFKRNTSYMHQFRDMLTDKSVLQIFADKTLKPEDFVNLSFRTLNDLTLFKLFDRVEDKQSPLIYKNPAAFKFAGEPLLCHILRSCPYLAEYLMKARDMTPEMIRATIEGDANCVQYFERIAPWMAELAVSLKPGSIYFIPEIAQTPQVQLICVQKAIETKDWSAIINIKNPTEQVKRLASNANSRLAERFGMASS